MVPVTSVLVMFSNTRPDSRRKGLSASGDRSGMGILRVGLPTTTDGATMAGSWSGPLNRSRWNERDGGVQRDGDEVLARCLHHGSPDRAASGEDEMVERQGGE